MKFFYFLLLLCTINGAQATNSSGPLHTLFTTSHERHQLDRMRAAGKFTRATSHKPVPKTSALKLKMQGVLIHGKQEPVAFINNLSTRKSSRLNPDIRVNTRRIEADKLSVPVTVGDRHIQLKPGQTWDTNKTRAVESHKLKIRTHDKQLVIQNTKAPTNN